MLSLGSTVVAVALPLWLGRRLAEREVELDRRALEAAEREALVLMAGASLAPRSDLTNASPRDRFEVLERRAL